MTADNEEAKLRSVQVETEVPGTPEEVWEAIATGPGVSSWFVPTDVETDAEGNPTVVVSHFGPGMDGSATVTAWEPPHRFAAESRNLGPNAPPLATEWTVEARAGGTCTVRVVHSLFASSDEWDDQLKNIESGWPGFFRILKLYLEHFRGSVCTSIQVMGMTKGSESDAWLALKGQLGIKGAAKGNRDGSSTAGAPPLAGIVERKSDGDAHYDLLLRLDQPAPGIASLCVYECGGPIFALVSLYLYGDQAASVAQRDEPLWRAWMSELFPMPQH